MLVDGPMKGLRLKLKREIDADISVFPKYTIVTLSMSSSRV